MKILKRIGLVLLSLIALLLVITAFTAKEYSVTREITIDKPSADVFAYVSLLKNQDAYNEWNMADPTMEKVFKNADGTVGFSYYWNSKSDEVGEGTQTISGIEPGKSIATTIHFIRPFEGDGDTKMTTEALNPTQTKVQWTFHGKMSWPENGMLLVMDMDSALGAHLEKSLSNLKTELEK